MFSRCAIKCYLQNAIYVIIFLGSHQSDNSNNVPDTGNVVSDEVKRLTEQLNQMKEQVFLHISIFWLM